MPLEIHLRKPPQEGLQPADGTVRIAFDVNLGLEDLELYSDAVALVFQDRDEVTSTVAILANHVRFDPEEIADRKPRLIESVAAALINNSSFPQDQELYVRFTPQEIRGIYADGVIFTSQVAVNDTFLGLLPESSLADDSSSLERSERLNIILDRIHLSGSDDLKKLRMRVVAQGATEYPTAALRLIEDIEEERNSLAARPELKEVTRENSATA